MRSWALLAAFLLLGPACRHPKSTVEPGSKSWAQKLDASLAQQAQTPQVVRDRALLGSAYLPQSPDPKRYAKLRILGGLDALGAYALAVRGMRTRNVDDLWLAAHALLTQDQDAHKHNSKHDRSGSPATAQVLGWLWEQVQDQPEQYPRIFELHRNFAPQTLTPQTRRSLLSLMGKAKRTRGEPYREYYEQQGCIQDWSASPVIGVLGDLSLTRADLTKPPQPLASDAPIFKLACATRVWNPTDNSGYRRLQSDLTLDKPGLMLSLTSPAVVRVLLDGQEVWRRDPANRIPARSKELWIDAEPGVHRLEVALAIPGERAWMVVRATDAFGQGIAARPAQGPMPAPAKTRTVQARDRDREQACRAQLASPTLSDRRVAEPWIVHCAMHDALERDDWEAAFVFQQKMRPFTQFAEGLALLADADMANPEMTANDRRGQAIIHLSQAVKRDPNLLGLSLSLQAHRQKRGEEDEVRQALQKRPAPTHIDDALFRFGVYREVGDELRADQMLRRAETLKPRHCEVIAAKFRQARDRDARARQAELLPELRRCPGSKTLAMRFWMQRGQHERALALADALLAEHGDDLDDRLRRATIRRRLGQEQQAQQDLNFILALSPGHMGARLALADHDRARGDTKNAKARLQALLDRYPANAEIRHYLEDLGVHDPLLAEEIDGEALVRKDRGPNSASAAFAKDAAVYLLDRDVVHVYQDGSQRHLIHQIVRVQSKEAIDAYGEVEIPQGAELLILRTIKEDGRTVDPERTAGKSSYSLRALELGDYVEQAWIMPAQGAQARLGSTDLGGFRFASTRAPFVRSELLIRAPKSIGLTVESRNGAPQPKVREKGEEQSWHFVARNQPRVVPEPGSPSLQDVIPQVRCFANLDVSQWLAEIVARSPEARRLGPTLRRALKDWTSPKQTPMQTLEAIYRQVHENVESEGGLGQSVNVTWSHGKGNRTELMAALLQAAGIPARILLARPPFGPKLDPGQGHPQFETYETGVLEIWPQDAKRRRLLLADLPFAPIGYLPDLLQGARAYPVGTPDSPSSAEPIVLDKGLAELDDARHYDVHIHLDPAGNATLRGTLELSGLEAAQWRQALKQSDPELRNELFTRYELKRFAPGSTLKLQSLKIERTQALQQPLMFRFTIDAQNFAQRQGETLRWTTRFLALNPGATLAGLDRRKLGLLIPVASRQRARISISLPAKVQWQITDPSALQSNIDGPFGRFTQSAKMDSGSWVIQMTSQLRPQIVASTRYPAFVQFVREVEKVQRQPMRASLR